MTSASVKKRVAWLAFAAYLTSLLIWAGTSVVSKVTVSQFPVFTTLFWRFCLASLLMLPLFFYQQRKTPLKWRDAASLAGLGMVGFSISIGLFFVGIQRASVLDASVILALGPMMIAAAGWLVLHERFNIYSLLGMAIALFGATWALTGDAAITNHSWSGDIFLLISELAAVVYTIGSKEVVRRVPPIHIATVSFVVAMVTFAPFAWWEWLTQPHIPVASWPIMSGIIYLAALSAVVAYLLFEWSLTSLTATTVGALSYIQSLASVALAVIFLGEHIDMAYVIGGVCALIGIAMAIHTPTEEHRGKMAHQHLPSRHHRHRR